MQLFIESDPDNQLYRIGQGTEPDDENRIQGPVVNWGEVAELEVDGKILRALVTEDGEIVSVGGVTLEFDGSPTPEDWDLAEDFEAQECGDEEEPGSDSD